MSTKTTFKRIALVAVAALGLGVVSSVAPANAGTVYTSSIAVSTNVAPVAGANGTVVAHTVRFLSATTGSGLTVSPKVTLTSKPATSSLALQAEGGVTAVAIAKAEFGSAVADTTDATDFVAVDNNTVSLASESGYTYYTALAYLHARYDVAGTYTWTIWDDSTTANGVLNGSEVSTTFTVVVGGTGTTSTYTATTTAWGTTSAEDGANGALIRLALKDAAGNAASPDTAGGVKVTVSGSGKVATVGTTDVADASSYILASGDFDGSGYAWFNVTDATAETVVVSFSGTGSMASSFTAPASVSLTYKADAARTTAPVIALGATTGLQVNTAATAVADGAADANYALASAITFKTGSSAATPAAYDKVIITDTSGKITGLATAAYDQAVLEGDSDTCTNCGTFSVTPAWGSLSGKTFEVGNLNGFGLVVTSEAAAATTATVSSSDSFKAINAAKVSFAVTVKNQFGVAMSGVAVSGSIAGRNATVAVASAITNADGVASLSYTDASTSTTSLVDTITFTAAAGITDTATVTFTSAANLGVSTISLVTPSETTAGTVNTPVVYSAIKAGDGVEAGQVSVTATVKDANAVILAGIPVTFTVSGTTAAITSTTQTVYTGATGTATAKLYAWAAGTYTVTATSGTVSDTAVSSWSQEDGTYARTVSAAKGAGNGSVVATVKDRLGNPVKGVELTATRVGSGSFGGASSINGTTGADGTVEFLLQDGSATVTVAFSSTTFGQSDAAAGLIDGKTATNVFTAYTAGDALTNEEGVGSTFSAAGVNSASVEAANDGSQAATDAASEATDAANAATDAANAAAEAADAATAAAQDAADAVAALSAQVASLISGLKSQLTALTNLVIKIQKKVKA